VKSGRYQIPVSLVNFGPVTKRIQVNEGGGTTVDAVLPLSLTAEVTVTGHRSFRNSRKWRIPRRA
jgi:hypothetical protein